MKKMKIIQTPVRFFPAVGGVEKYTHLLSRELVRNGQEVKVFCANDPVSTIKEKDGISIERLCYMGKVANTNITPMLFFKLLREKFDIIHTHMPTPWSADISMLVSLIRRKPLVITYHNDLEKSGKTKFLAKLYNWTFLKLLLRKSKKIIATSSSYIDNSSYLKSYINRIAVVPNGVALEEFKIDKKNKRVDHQIFFLSVLDAFHKYKGLDYLLESMVDVVKKFPDAKLLIGGSGELIKEYEKMTKELKISKNVDFLGYVEEKTLKELYQQSTVFALPSIDKNEGFGIVLLEAMAYNTPVITTTIPGISGDIKKHRTGLIIPPKDSKQLSESIIWLFKNKGLAEEMGNSGRNLVEKKYNWKKISREIEKIYLQLLN